MPSAISISCNLYRDYKQWVQLSKYHDQIASEILKGKRKLLADYAGACDVGDWDGDLYVDAEACCYEGGVHGHFADDGEGWRYGFDYLWT